MSALKDKQGYVAEDELSFRSKMALLLKSFFIMFIYGIIIAGIGLVAGIVITNNYGYKLQDVGFMIGVGVLIIGIIMMIGMRNSDTSYINLVASIRERELDQNNRDTSSHSMIGLAPRKICLVLGGGILIIISVLFL